MLTFASFIFLTTESIGELLHPCGYISPESPVVQLHSNFTAVCVLKEKCMDYFHVNANDIVWKTNHFAILKETSSSCYNFSSTYKVKLKLFYL
uniref:Immunoglobulin C2-set-like ligand-binding domain-containing protein n=1 Tax=Gorilla gorilla gorilla TaxID=9595 RepID=A0A2I2ZM80_GORGO